MKIENFQTTQSYKYPKKVIVKFKVKQRNRNLHGASIKAKLEEIKSRFSTQSELSLPYPNLLKDDVVYVKFISPWGFELKYEQLVDNTPFPKYHLLSIQKEAKVVHDKEESRYVALVMLNEKGVSHFINRVKKYLTQNTKTNKPEANDLISNIEDIQVATLKAFWTDGVTHPFPEENEEVWWEVWFRNTAYDLEKIAAQLEAVGAQLGLQKLVFKEQTIHLVKGTAIQLANSIMLLDCISELRKPQIINDFITHSEITYQDEQEWIKDLLKRTEFRGNEGDSQVLISLFDTGVNNFHPLLKTIIPDDHLDTWRTEWGKSDSEPNGGHGTGMAGLALYGNLTDALADAGIIRIYHGAESFKIAHPSSKRTPQLYGVIYQDGHSKLITARPYSKRVFCMAITNDGLIKSGRPSSSSTALDRIIAGSPTQEDAVLFFVSAGNAQIQKADQFPDMNFIQSIEDPGQAYNAITVGACTFMDTTTDHLVPVAKMGEMSPFNTTSGAWEPQWPNKPDLVYEGGNLAYDERDGFSLSHEQLSPLSLDEDFRNRLFTPFNATSAASALVSKMAAELCLEYPAFWPETIRGLLIHSAYWTPAMLARYNFEGNENHRRAILRSVGYGVPNLERARQSANNSLTLISEEYITPYRKEGSNVKFNEYHLYKLPWPQDVLLNEIGEVNTRLTVTLSYYIEPNPNGKEYARAFSYHSHELEFKMIKSGETLEEFKRRISAASDSDDLDEPMAPDSSSEKWVIRERVRSKGSIKKDFLDTIGAELHDRNIIAVYPKSGWYKSRKAANRHDQRVRYSLIISIDTEKQDVDIYTPVENLILNKIPVSI